MTLRLLVAGFAAGYAMALATTAALTYILARLVPAATLERWVDRGVPRVLVVSQLMVGATMLWTMAGLALASAYILGDFAGDRDALGSRSITWTGVMAALAFLPLPPLVAIWRQCWWLWCGMSVLFLLAFGWLMPLAGE